MPKSRIRRRNAYRPPEGTPRAVRVGSPPWLVPVMVGCFVVGLLWVVTYYVTQTDYPIGAIGLWNMAHRLRLHHPRVHPLHPLEVAPPSAPAMGERPAVVR